MTTPCVLVIDDEDNLVKSLIFGLKAHGIPAAGAHDAAEGLAAVERLKPGMVLVDLCLPDATGMDVLCTLKARHPDLPIAMISAHGDIRVAVEAVKVGAVDFIAKPFELDDVIDLIRRSVNRTVASRPTPPRPRQTADESGELIGSSPVMQAVREQVEVVARSSARIVLLLGPSGTGKGLIARCLHGASPRSGGPFVVVNCASLPEQLLEAELFGAERGAYTGAYQKRVGLVELAESGTLFLDEVGELPLALQAKLLRFLENRTFRPVGGAGERTANVRVVAATNRDIEEALKSGEFRADLFYRLNVVPITVPPLADRRSDILPLAEFFAAQQAKTEGCPAIRLAAETQERLKRYSWPGNIRELRNLIERLTILHPGRIIEPAHLPAEFLGDSAPAGSGITELLGATERDILLRALRQADGAKGKAAEILGISRHAFKRRLNRLNID
jgi:DNA-binding NtrC family response regulator